MKVKLVSGKGNVLSENVLEFSEIVKRHRIHSTEWAEHEVRTECHKFVVTRDNLTGEIEAWYNPFCANHGSVRYFGERSRQKSGITGLYLHALGGGYVDLEKMEIYGQSGDYGKYPKELEYEGFTNK